MNDLEATLTLTRTQGLGSRTYLDWITRFESPQEALKENPSNFMFPSLKSIQEEIRKAEKFGAQLITIHSPLYPPLLKEIHSPPIVLTVKGNIDLLSKPSIGIVGARNASSTGRVLTRNISKDLGTHGFVITSGLARGIDAAAHKGALETGTIAVIGSGIDVFYPEENKTLQEEIYEKGLVVSQFMFGEPPQATHFPKRNHIISGLSKGILVIEAAFKSGSLITAHAALEQNREVMAVPGSPMDPRCHGTNKLLKDGAILIENANDVLQGLGVTFEKKETKSLSKPLTKEPSQEAILENLSYTPTHLDQLISDLKMPPNKVHAILLELELDEKIERLPGNKIVLKLENC